MQCRLRKPSCAGVVLRVWLELIALGELPPSRRAGSSRFEHRFRSNKPVGAATPAPTILSMPRGPSEVRMASATALAASIFMSRTSFFLADSLQRRGIHNGPAHIAVCSEGSTSASRCCCCQAPCPAAASCLQQRAAQCAPQPRSKASWQRWQGKQLAADRRGQVKKQERHRPVLAHL